MSERRNKGLGVRRVTCAWVDFKQTFTQFVNHIFFSFIFLFKYNSSWIYSRFYVSRLTNSSTHPFGLFPFVLSFVSCIRCSIHLFMSLFVYFVRPVILSFVLPFIRLSVCYVHPVIFSSVRTFIFSLFHPSISIPAFSKRQNEPSNGVEKLEFQFLTFKKSKWLQKWSRKIGISIPYFQRSQMTPKMG